MILARFEFRPCFMLVWLYAVGKFASGRVGICRLYWFLALFRPFDSLGRFAMGWRFYCFSRFYAGLAFYWFLMLQV